MENVKLALNQQDAAAALDMGVDHFDAHVRPYLRPVYIGGARRYRVTELQDWLDKEATGAALRRTSPEVPAWFEALPHGRPEQLSNVVDRGLDRNQAATLSSVVVVSWSVARMPSLNCVPASTSLTSSWPLKRRQRS